MVDLRAVYIANGIGAFLLLILNFASQTRNLRGRVEDRLFTFMVNGVLIGCLVEMLGYTIDGRIFPGSRILNYAANTYLYSFNMLLPLGMVFYVDLGLFSDPSRIWKRYKPQIFVAAVMVFLNVINFFTPIIYDISADNVYARCPLSYSYYAAILFFFTTAIVQTLRYEKQYGTRSFVNIFVFLLPILTGTGLQFLVYGLSLAWLSSAVGLAGLYMMQQNEMAFIDPLVGIYNRQYLTHVLSSWISKGKHFAGAMLDFDHFKRINDDYGHSEGDKALKTIADVLKAARKENEWIFRFAGDEFVILKITSDENGLADYLAEVERLLAEYNSEGRPYLLSLSSGTSYFESGELDRFMRQMDASMYAMKKEHHAMLDGAPPRSFPRSGKRFGTVKQKPGPV